MWPMANESGVVGIAAGRVLYSRPAESSLVAVARSSPVKDATLVTDVLLAGWPAGRTVSINIKRAGQLGRNQIRKYKSWPGMGESNSEYITAKLFARGWYFDSTITLLVFGILETKPLSKRSITRRTQAHLKRIIYKVLSFISSSTDGSAVTWSKLSQRLESESSIFISFGCTSTVN